MSVAHRMRDGEHWSATDSAIDSEGALGGIHFHAHVGMRVTPSSQDDGSRLAVTSRCHATFGCNLTKDLIERHVFPHGSVVLTRYE